MIINRLSLCDYRVFRGEHDFELKPRVKYGRERPITIFGGLNGAGKTTILSAIRLALYGKRSFGANVSEKQYNEYLIESVNKSTGTLIPANAAWIELAFSYGQDGEITEYVVRRSWVRKGKQAEEWLTVTQDDRPLTEFSKEQCQGFLEELIPIGMSDLFFFDGERIADLAEDETGRVLNDAFRKLIGLDIVERLDNDLTIYIRNQNKKANSDSLAKEIEKDEQQYQESLHKKEEARTAADHIKTQIVALEREISHLEDRFAEKGGIWAKTRSAEKANQDRFLTERDQLQRELREELSGAAPLNLVDNKLQSLKDELHQGLQQREARLLADTIAPRLEDLKARVNPNTGQDLDQVFDDVFGDLLQPDAASDQEAPRLDLGQSQVAKIDTWITESIPKSFERLVALRKRLDTVQQELEESGVRLQRAPDDEVLQTEMQKLGRAKEKREELDRQYREQIETARRHLREAIQATRRLVKHHEYQEKRQRSDSAIIYAANSRKLLKTFAHKSLAKRISELERRFHEAFGRLARKEDMISKVNIDPESLDVELFDNDGHRLAKKDLSAGERQIYAIAMLEALTQTSGRKLPVIIDTPLGRLDSKHRAKLVEEYFPRASHQVIILSTDTEIDQEFYRALSPSISRGYELIYDPKERSSYARSGYFWRWEEHRERVANAT